MKFKKMNVPNKLTTIRMFCVPLVLVLFVLYALNLYMGWPTDYRISIASGYITVVQMLIIVFFAFASITDYFDGHIARKQNIVSDYGKLMDPLADKLLVNTTLMCIMAFGFVNFNGQAMIMGIICSFFILVTIARDLFVDALRMQALKKNVVTAARFIGKLKTATLMPGIVILLVGGCYSIVIYYIGAILVSLGGLFALIGGITYFKDMAPYIGD